MATDIKEKLHKIIEYSKVRRVIVDGNTAEVVLELGSNLIIINIER